MEFGTEVFANWQTLVFAVSVYLVTYVARTVVQYLWAGWKTSRLYNDLLLHLAPIGNGLALALVAKSFPWPEALGTSLSARLMFGAVVGLFSGMLYGRVRALLSGKPVEEDDVQQPPAA